MLDDHKQNLNQVLNLWDRCDLEADAEAGFDESRKKLVYILEHEYSEANISVNQLKGKDQSRMRYLSEACRDSGFCLLFAHFQLSVQGSVDEDEDDPNWAAGVDFHEIMDELESKWKLKTVFQLDGQKIAEGIDLEEDEDIINYQNFREIEPDDEECDGWTGNEGCTATHFYFRTCAVILPRRRRLDLLSEAETLDVKVYVDSLLNEIQDPNLSVMSKKELRNLCEMVIDAKKSPEKARKNVANDKFNRNPWGIEEEPDIKLLSRVSDLGMGSILQAALTLDIPEVVEAAIGMVAKTLPSSVFRDMGKHLAGKATTTWLGW